MTPAKTTRKGVYITVYLDPPLQDYLEQQAAIDQTGLSTFIRNLIIECSPPEIRAQSKQYRKRRPKHLLTREIPPDGILPPPLPKKRVLALPETVQPWTTINMAKHEPVPRGAPCEAQKAAILAMMKVGPGYSAGYVSTTLKLPYRLVEEVIATIKKRPSP